MLLIFGMWNSWCLLRVSWTAKRSNQSILKEISPKYSMEGKMLKLKSQYSGHLMRRTDSLDKTLMLGKTEDGRRRGRQRMKWLDGITDSMTWVLGWWWTGRPGVLRSMGSQRVRHGWVTELNWGVVFWKKFLWVLVGHEKLPLWSKLRIDLDVHSWPSVSSGDNFRTLEDTKTCWWSSPLYKMTQYLHITYTHPPVNFRSSLDYLWYLIQYKHYANRCQCGKFTFYFLEPSGIFFPNIFDLRLVESVNVEPGDIAGQMYS